MTSTMLEDVVHSFAFVHSRNRKLLHNSNMELSSSTIQEHLYSVFILYLYFSRILNIKKGTVLFNFKKGK